MTHLVFDNTVAGHHLEYLHHIYSYMADRPELGSVVFVVPLSFRQVSDKFVWKQVSHIQYCYLTAEEQKLCDNSNLLKAAWYKSLILRRYVLKFKAGTVFLVMLMLLMPFVALMMPKGVKVRGVIYRIYLYEWKNLSWVRRLQEVVKYGLLARCPSIDRPLVLNDQSAACYLNRLYHTQKFTYIPDPITVSAGGAQDIRSELGISPSQQIFLHFGGLSGRKGTMVILDAIALMSGEERKRNVFIFAGRIYRDIRESFYEKCEQLKAQGAQIWVYDEFCAYEFLRDLCFTCDKILIPYSNTTQSSGVIGYAAVFGKPVIAPSAGLLGKLVRRYRLGIGLSDINAEELHRSFTREPVDFGANLYVKNNTVSKFCEVICGR